MIISALRGAEEIPANGLCQDATNGDEWTEFAGSPDEISPGLGFHEARAKVFGFDVYQALSYATMYPAQPSPSLAETIHLYRLSARQKEKLVWMAIRRGDGKMMSALPGLNLSPEAIEIIYRRLPNDAVFARTFDNASSYSNYYRPYRTLATALVDLQPQLGEEKTYQLVLLYLDYLAGDFERLMYPDYPPLFLRAVKDPKHQSEIKILFIAKSAAGAIRARGWTAVNQEHPYHWMNWYANPFSVGEAEEIIQYLSTQFKNTPFENETELARFRERLVKLAKQWK